jgi:hypothetical protein
VKLERGLLLNVKDCHECIARGYLRQSKTQFCEHFKKEHLKDARFKVPPASGSKLPDVIAEYTQEPGVLYRCCEILFTDDDSLMDHVVECHWHPVSITSSAPLSRSHSLLGLSGASTPGKSGIHYSGRIYHQGSPFSGNIMSTSPMSTGSHLHPGGSSPHQGVQETFARWPGFNRTTPTFAGSSLLPPAPSQPAPASPLNMPSNMQHNEQPFYATDNIEVISYDQYHNTTSNTNYFNQRRSLILLPASFTHPLWRIRWHTKTIPRHRRNLKSFWCTGWKFLISLSLSGSYLCICFISSILRDTLDYGVLLIPYTPSACVYVEVFLSHSIDPQWHPQKM